MAKFTPGPWTVEPYLTPERDDDPMGVYIIRPAHEKLTEQYFATDPEDDPDFDSVHDENQANANLCAAAPALYAAARDAFELLMDMIPKDDPWNMPPTILQQLAAALTQADGEERIL